MAPCPGRPAPRPARDGSGGSEHGAIPPGGDCRRPGARCPRARALLGLDRRPQRLGVQCHQVRGGAARPPRLVAPAHRAAPEGAAAAPPVRPPGVGPRPAHVLPGTPAENTADMVARGRRAGRRRGAQRPRPAHHRAGLRDPAPVPAAPGDARHAGQAIRRLRQCDQEDPPEDQVAPAEVALHADGEGPHGTLYVLRLYSFPEGATDGGGATALERAVFGSRAFFLRGHRRLAPPGDEPPTALPRGAPRTAATGSGARGPGDFSDQAVRPSAGRRGVLQRVGHGLLRRQRPPRRPCRAEGAAAEGRPRLGDQAVPVGAVRFVPAPRARTPWPGPPGRRSAAPPAPSPGAGRRPGPAR